MVYNTEREHLTIPEYGRNFQNLVKFITENIPDRDERNKAAQAVINLMSQQNPQMRNQPEFQQKLWDQLYILSEGKLDVDFPYPTPDLVSLHKPRKKRLDYSTNNLKYHFYGKNIELMIERALEMTDEEQKTKYITTIVNYMRYCYRTWNDDKVSDDIIIKHLDELSIGRLKVDKLPEAPRSEKTYSKDYRRFKPKNHNHGPKRQQN